LKITKLASGPGCDLYALIIKEDCLVQEFISRLEDRDKKKILALFNFILQKGPPFNETRFRYLGDEIYELKTVSGVRILSFFGNPILRKPLILTHGFYKPKKMQLKREKKRAVNWHKEYFQIADKRNETENTGMKS